MKSFFRRQSRSVEKMQPAFIILPLYIYPNPGMWDTLYSSIKSNPTVKFVIVINPFNGPGADMYPDAEYIAGISQLNSYPNTQLHGYVHLTSATRAQSDVKADISKYANWQAYTAADIHMEGIFFDEAPTEYSKPTYDYMSAVTNHARSALWADKVHVIFNPGVNVDTRFYELADVVNSYENFYSEFVQKDCISQIPANVVRKSSIMVHHFTGSLADQKKIVDRANAAGIRGIFISDEEYHSWSSLWSTFCADCSTN